MAKEKQAAEPRPEKINGRKAEQNLPAQAVAEIAPLAEAPVSPGMAAAAGDPGAQAERLADRRLAAAQRQGLARQIGQQQGNDHLQRLLVSLQRDPSPSKPANGAAGHGAHAVSTHADRMAPASSTTAAQATSVEELTGLSDLSLPDIAVSGSAEPRPAPGSIQRESDDHRSDEEKAKGRPTEAEKIIARAKAKRMLAQSEQTEGESAEETAKTHRQKETEQQSGEQARQKAESAKAEGAAATVGSSAGAGASVNAPKPVEEKAAGVGKAAGAAAVGPAVGISEDEPAATEFAEEAPSAVEGEKAPDSPEEDPAYQAVVGGVRRAGRTSKAHAPAQAKAAQAQAAAEMPAAEVDAHAEAGKVGQMEAAPNPGFDAAGFKAKLMQRIQGVAPKNMEQMDDFKESGKMEGVKSDMQAQAAQEKDTAKAPMKQAAAQPPDTASVPPKPVTPLSPENPGQPAQIVNPEAAAPKPKTPAEVEEPMRSNSRRLDQAMDEYQMTDRQLANSNEPQFLDALQAKQTAQAHAETAPGEYRQFEQAQVDEAKGEAVDTALAQTQQMHGQRAAILSQVTTHKSKTKIEDEAARAKVAADIQGIYDRTQTKVESILTKLDEDVEKTFNKEADAAREYFEEFVDTRMEAFKEDRYGGWFGWTDWLSDKISGMPSEVNDIYEAGRKLFLKNMDAVIDHVVAIIGSGLSEAKAEVANGKKEIQKLVAALPKNLQQVGQDAADNIEGKFEALEDTVDGKQDELMDTLAQNYQAKLKEVDARIEEMQKDDRGLVEKAYDAVVGAGKFLWKLKDMLYDVFKRVSGVVGRIIDDPGGFLDNFVAGVKKGFDNFRDHFVDNLKKALVGWLTGTLGAANLQLPDDVFSAEGAFSLVTQITGFTSEYLRKKAEDVLGPQVVQALLAGENILKTLLNEGPAGLWKLLQEQFSDLKELVIDFVMDMLKNEVITAGINWLGSLLTPVSGLIKIAKAIYNIIMFFVDHLGQLQDLLNTIIDSVEKVLDGSIDGAAQMIENALVKGLSFVIGLLASLLGLGDIGERVQSVFKRIHDRIDRAITKLLMKFKKYAGKTLGVVTGTNKMSPQERLNRGLNAGVRAVNRFAGRRVGALVLNPLLAAIRVRYQMQTLEVIQDGNVWDVYGEVNPRGKKKTEAQVEGEGEKQAAPVQSQENEVPVGTQIQLRKGKVGGKITERSWGIKPYKIAGYNETKDKILYEEIGGAEKGMLSISDRGTVWKIWSPESEPVPLEIVMKELYEPKWDEYRVARAVLNYRVRKSLNNPKGKDWEHIVEQSGEGEHSEKNLALTDSSFNRKELNQYFGQSREGFGRFPDTGKLSVRDYLDSINADETERRRWKERAYAAYGYRLEWMNSRFFSARYQVLVKK